jgi:hypothetical protein
VPSGTSKTIFEQMVCSVQTVHLSCTDTNTVSEQTKTRFHMTHVTYKFHRVHQKLFMSLWYVRCKPCTYLCADRNTVSEWTKTRLHTTHVTYEFHRMRPKLFMSQWYVLCKLRTYLASRLALSPKRWNLAWTRASLARSAIGYVQKEF